MHGCTGRTDRYRGKQTDEDISTPKNCRGFSIAVIIDAGTEISYVFLRPMDGIYIAIDVLVARCSLVSVICL